MVYPITDVRYFFARLHGTFTVTQRNVFYDLFQEANSDPIISIWISRVGLGGILGKRQGSLDGMQGGTGDMALLDLGSDANHNMNSTDTSFQAMTSGTADVSRKEIKTTKKLFTSVCEDPIFGAWLRRTDHDDLRYALHHRRFPNASELADFKIHLEEQYFNDAERRHLA
ncbi:hypothetical protein QFC21_002994 [Naganishia friedmannii]|uniref:Uncharacterized protein n=1 Tax=Naganishia friedmannii TaxID=89922 RepID=A0ACC2VT76_9TREE|nr:hypothetical protein QFC21_002994 [Naganishia friedmannii]